MTNTDDIEPRPKARIPELDEELHRRDPNAALDAYRVEIYAATRENMRLNVERMKRIEAIRSNQSDH